MLYYSLLFIIFAEKKQFTRVEFQRKTTAGRLVECSLPPRRQPSADKRINKSVGSDFDFGIQTEN